LKSEELQVGGKRNKMNITCVRFISLLYLSMWQKFIACNIYPNITYLPFSNRKRRQRIYTHKMERENTVKETTERGCTKNLHSEINQRRCSIIKGQEFGYGTQ
jgi:hypothetical protein